MGTVPGKCDDTTTEDNRTAAKQLVGDRSYGAVQVIVKDSDPVARTVRLVLPMANGDPKELELKWGDIDTMWASCPSSLPSSAVPNDAGPVPSKGATGTLLLSSTVLAPGGVESGIQHDLTKWPREWAADNDYYQAVKVWPTKIQVTGIAIETGSVQEYTVDLLDATMAKPNQTIKADHHTLRLSLTRDGCAAFGQTFSGAHHLSRSVEVILSEKANPDALIEAWKIVSAAVKQYRLNSTASNIPDVENALGLLRKVLPRLSAVSGSG